MSSHNYSTDEPLDGDGWEDADDGDSFSHNDGPPDLGPLDSLLPSLNGNAVPPVPPLPPTLSATQSSNGSDHIPDLEELAVAAGLSSDEISRLRLSESDELQSADSAEFESDIDAFDSPRAPARRILHPFDVPAEQAAPIEQTVPSEHTASIDQALPIEQYPVMSGGGVDDHSFNPGGSPGDFDYSQPDTPSESARPRAPITDEVPVVAPPPAPHTMSTSLISGGIGDAPAGDPVDQIAVRKLGGFNFMSIPQWMMLPRDEKARLIKGELVTFMYEGEEVSLRAALLYLKSLNGEGGDRHDNRR